MNKKIKKKIVVKIRVVQMVVAVTDVILENAVTRVAQMAAVLKKIIVVNTR